MVLIFLLLSMFILLPSNVLATDGMDDDSLMNAPLNEKLDNNNELQDEDDDGEVDSQVEVQEVKVYISKLDNEKKDLQGAKLQIIDSKGNVVDEWVTDGSKHEVLLKGGKYTLHELKHLKAMI